MWATAVLTPLLLVAAMLPGIRKRPLETAVRLERLWAAPPVPHRGGGGCGACGSARPALPARCSPGLGWAPPPACYEARRSSAM